MFLLWYYLYFNFVRIRTVNICKTVRLCVTVSECVGEQVCAQVCDMHVSECFHFGSLKPVKRRPQPDDTHL